MGKVQGGNRSVLILCAWLWLGRFPFGFGLGYGVYFRCGWGVVLVRVRCACPLRILRPSTLSDKKDQKPRWRQALVMVEESLGGALVRFTLPIIFPEKPKPQQMR